MAPSRSLRLSLHLTTRARRDRRRDLTTALGREQHGSYEVERPEGPLLWVHIGPKLGDLGVLSDLLHRITAERDDTSVLVTLEAETKPDGGELLLIHAPDDTLPAVRRFLSHWRPDMGLWTGADFRPALISEAAERGIPLMLTETKGAVPPRPGVSRGVISDLLQGFEAILAGDAQSATAFRQLGAPKARVQSLGYLQQGGIAPPCNQAERDDLALVIGGRPTWYAASVAEAELDAVVAAHSLGLRRSHRLLLLLEPETPEMGPGWAARLTEQGFGVALRSAGAEPQTDAQIYITDTEGEAGLWYRLAPISFLGQSLIEGGAGISPFAAAALGSALVAGPHVGAHAGAYHMLIGAGAGRQIAGPEALGPVLEGLLSPARAAEQAHKAWEVTSEGASVMDRLVDLVLTELDTR